MPPLAAAVAVGAGASSDDPVVLEIHLPNRVPLSLLPVSYTHLTLPTIYSV